MDVDILGATTTCSIDDSTITVNYTELTDHKGYILNNIKFDIIASDTATHATYSYFIVPYEVSLERSVYMGGSLGALVSIIPLLIIAGLVIGAVTWFMLRKG